ncbi:hypothetical protein [Brachybacterium sp. UNK5269]|uniref:hypothetical protein n=1 Tax=Brachybacterium sp. UNK5269 TaxID=3408576 RepID=UPI003BB09ED1
MRLEYTPPEADGWAEIAANPIEFDANPPLQKLRVQWPLGDANVDRTAVASSLIFSPWIAGRCDHIRPFSALTVQRIVEWFQTQNIWVSPTPVRSGGLQIPRGHRRIRLGTPHEIDDSAMTILNFVAPLAGSGQDGDSVQIASNVGTLLQNAPTQADRFAMEIGLGVLLAGSLSASEFIYPEFAASSPDAFAAVARLIESVSLGLRLE